jgi:hypothetical protein
MTSAPTSRLQLGLDQLPMWAVGGAGCGLLTELSLIPAVVKGVLLLAFVLVGPGSAALYRIGPTLPPVAARALVPVTGLAIVTLTTTGSLFMGIWSPRATLLGLAVLTALVGCAQLWREHGEGVPGD